MSQALTHLLNVVALFCATPVPPEYQHFIDVLHDAGSRGQVSDKRLFYL